MKNVRMIVLGLGVAILSLLTITGVAHAQTTKNDDNVTVARSTTVDSLLFAGGSTITIDGTVNGDVFCAGQNITINGIVHGDVFCAGQTITINGVVDGSVRVAGQVVTIGGTINGNATVFAQTMSLGKSSIISGDFIGGAQDAVLSGSVKRDVQIGVATLTVDGTVGRNLKGEIESLTVGSTGRVGADIDYASNKEPRVMSGGVITGVVTRTPIKAQQQTSSQELIGQTLGWILYVFIATLLMALVVAFLVPRLLNQAVASTTQRPSRTGLIGIVAIIVVPVITVLLAITIIGLPLAAILFFAWLISMIIAGPFAGYLIGRIILKKSQRPLITMLVGMSILLLFEAIPFFGAFVWFVAFVYGIGMILDQVILYRDGKKIKA